MLLKGGGIKMRVWRDIKNPHKSAFFNLKMERTPTIFIDICHLPQANFFKNAVNSLYGKLNVALLIRERGNLKKIVEKEYPPVPVLVFGAYKDSLVKKIYNNIQREFLLLNFFKKNRFDALMGVGSYFLPPISSLHNKPSIIFTDDLEHAVHFYLNKFLSTYFVFPTSITKNGKNVIKYRGIKELAYLHPNYFEHTKKILDEYDLEEGKYAFIRVTTNTSINYRRQEQFLSIKKWQKIIQYFKKKEMDIVLSLEDKKYSKSFKGAIILNEPVDDFYSLIKYSQMLISTGDTMAREACVLGVPSIYIGGRKMAVNKELIEKKIMFTPEDFGHLHRIIDFIIDNDIKKYAERIIDHAIKYEWDDTTQVIIDVLSAALYHDDGLIEKYKHT